MKKQFIAAVAAVASIVGLVGPDPAGAIIGGTPDGTAHPYVGQLLFYVPSAQDSRFNTPGGWFNCTGTLIDADTVVTAGHCTFDVGLDGAAAPSGYSGGNDIWFSVAEAPDYSILPPSSTFAPNGNQARYNAWSAALDASPTWSQVSAVYTHPDYNDAAFLFHDLGVFTLAEPIALSEYGQLPSTNYLSQYAGNAKHTASFLSVGYGLEDSSPKMSAGGDTRRSVGRTLTSFRGVYGLRDIAVKFSNNNTGTCFGDSGGPTLDTTGNPDGNTIVAVTSFGLNQNCTAGGSYRIDQPDDLAFITSHD